MRANDHVAQAWVLRHLGAQRNRAARLGPALLEQLAHAGRVDDAAGVGVGERHVELGGAVLTQQATQLKRDAAEVLPAIGAAHQEAAALRRRVLQAVGAAVLTRRALLGDEGDDVSGVLDTFVAAPAARVRGDDGRSVDDPHGVGVGEDHELTAHVGVRHRVVVAVEADIRRLADVDGRLLIAREGGGGQRQQPRLLLGEGLAFVTNVNCVRLIVLTSCFAPEKKPQRVSRNRRSVNRRKNSRHKCADSERDKMKNMADSTVKRMVSMSA